MAFIAEQLQQQMTPTPSYLGPQCEVAGYTRIQEAFHRLYDDKWRSFRKLDFLSVVIPNLAMGLRRWTMAWMVACDPTVPGCRCHLLLKLFCYECHRAARSHDLAVP